MNSFYWGDRHQPTLALDQTDTHVLVRLDGRDRHIPRTKIVGWVQDGQRVQCLVSGGSWLWGTARDRDGVLWVELDCGRSWIVSNARLLKVQQLSLFEAPASVPNTVDEIAPNVQKRRTRQAVFLSEPVPMPKLEDYEEDEMYLAYQYDLLEPLKTGDRIRIVLAGAPLEHLTGALGTVEGELKPLKPR